MRVYEHIKALPPAGIGNSANTAKALAFVTVIACATSASAQSVPNKAELNKCLCDAVLCAVGEGPERRRQKEEETGGKARSDPRARSVGCSNGCSIAGVREHPGPTSAEPAYALVGRAKSNYTNFAMGPLHKTQNILIVEPIIPLKLTPGLEPNYPLEHSHHIYAAAHVLPWHSRQ